MRTRFALPLFALFIGALSVFAAAPRTVSAAATYTIHLEGDSTLSVSRIEPWPQGTTRVWRVDGTAVFLSNEKIESITDESGRDRTQEVLRDGKTLGDKSNHGEATPGSTPRDVTHGFCFRAQPLPKCKSYFIYNVGISAELTNAGPSQNTTDQTALSLEVGYMRNLTPKRSVGFGLLGMASGETAKLAVRGRYRRWLSRTVGLDGALGLTVAGGDEYGNYPIFPGVIASLGVQAGGLAGATLEAEQVRYHGSAGSATQVRIRGELGSAFGLAGTVFVLVAGVVIAATLSD